MKRFICIILAAVLTFSHCSCGEKAARVEDALKTLVNRSGQTSPIE